MRLDLYLAEKKFVTSRSRAANLIELGKVTVNSATVTKAGYDVKENDVVLLSGDYGASLGGIKLSDALKEFKCTCDGKVCLDVGASNGGFTEVLLKNNAKIVYALDVGECALPSDLRQNEKVVIMDKYNARDILPELFPLLPQFTVIDVSFISLTLILPSVIKCLADGGEIIALIKPQFECGKKDLSKKGILIDVKKRQKVVERIEKFCLDLGLKVLGNIPAPHPFEGKNQEYLIYLKKD